MLSKFNENIALDRRPSFGVEKDSAIKWSKTFFFEAWSWWDSKFMFFRLERSLWLDSVWKCDAVLFAYTVMTLCYEKKMLTRSLFSDIDWRHFSNLSYSESPTDMPNKIPAFFLRDSALQINTDRHTSSLINIYCKMYVLLVKVFPFQQNTKSISYCFSLLLETYPTDFNSIFCTLSNRNIATILF